MTKFTIALSSFSLLSALILNLPAYADAQNDATDLLPLETRRLVVEANPDIYSTAAHQINTYDPEQSESSGLADLLGAGFLEGLVDENGEVDLPLGITVFDAMGTTSVGFGSDF